MVPECAYTSYRCSLHLQKLFPHTSLYVEFPVFFFLLLKKEEGNL